MSCGRSKTIKNENKWLTMTGVKAGTVALSCRGTAGRWRAAASGLGQFETLVVVVGTVETTLLGVVTAAAAAAVLGVPVPPARISRQTAADSTTGMIPGLLTVEMTTCGDTAGRGRAVVSGPVRLGMIRLWTRPLAATVAEVVAWVILPTEMMTAAPATTSVGETAAVAAVASLVMGWESRPCGCRRTAG